MPDVLRERTGRRLMMPDAAMERRLGGIRYRKLPVWTREGCSARIVRDLLRASAAGCRTLRRFAGSGTEPGRAALPDVQPQRRLPA